MQGAKVSNRKDCQKAAGTRQQAQFVSLRTKYLQL